jgi:hypothetical protein
VSHPGGTLRGVEGGVPAVRFATAARRLAAAARASGLLVPAFRSPPRRGTSSRTLRRYPGGAVVSVTLRGRAYAEVIDDMIEGVLVANRVTGDASERLRRAFRLALGEPEIDLVAEERRDARRDEASATPTLEGEARVAERQTQAA